MIDYYKSLGTKQFATAAEIKRAYRSLAKKWHPDCNQGDVNAAEVFKKINEAYYVLSKPDLKASYDFHLKSYLDALENAKRFNETPKVQTQVEVNKQFDILKSFVNKMKTAFEGVIFVEADTVNNRPDVKRIMNRIMISFENMIFEDEQSPKRKSLKKLTARQKIKRSFENILHLMYEDEK
jgi:DnaJ-class molecular chaperone